MVPGGCSPLGPLCQSEGAGRWLRGELSPAVGAQGPPLSPWLWGEH